MLNAWEIAQCIFFRKKRHISIIKKNVQLFSLTLGEFALGEFDLFVSIFFSSKDEISTCVLGGGGGGSPEDVSFMLFF